jgi:hypothetical protein
MMLHSFTQKFAPHFASKTKCSTTCTPFANDASSHVLFRPSNYSVLSRAIGTMLWQILRKSKVPYA